MALERLAPAVLGQLVSWLAPRLKSRTGWANARVRHVTALGYGLRAYQVFMPNIRAWLERREPLFPAVLQVQTVNRCNAACKMCPYPYTTGLEPYQRMDDALWEKIVREATAEPAFRVMVPMAKNEPLLDPKLVERVALFRRLARPDQELELVTNGALLDGARLEQLAESGLDMVSISLNAAAPDTYSEMMGGLDLGRITRNLASLPEHVKARVSLFVRFVRQRGNYGEEKAFRRQWSKAGFNVLAIEVNDRSGTVRGYGELKQPESLRTRVRRALRRRLSRLIFPVCPYAFSVAHVLQNGDMPLCVNDWHNREVLGNVRERSIREIYNSPRVREIRELMLQNRYDEIAPCKDCSLWKESNWL